MWDAIGSAIKVFFEKHLIPTIISCTAAIAALLWIPNDFWMIEKIGTKLFLVFIAGTIFLLIRLLCLLAEGVRNMRNRICVASENRKYKKEEAEKEIEEYLSFVDSLPPEDRDLLLQFLKTENKPIAKYDTMWYKGYNSIYNSGVLIHTDNHDGTRMCKLDERFYETLNMIYKRRGSISHF